MTIYALKRFNRFLNCMSYFFRFICVRLKQTNKQKEQEKKVRKKCMKWKERKIASINAVWLCICFEFLQFAMWVHGCACVCALVWFTVAPTLNLCKIFSLVALNGIALHTYQVCVCVCGAVPVPHRIHTLNVACALDATNTYTITLSANVCK